jgi:hypothetical protein
MNAVRVIFAVVVTGVFIAFSYYLVDNADTTDQKEWERWVYVFGAAEAIAFAAVGWVFGKEVNRERAESAENRAKSAEAEKTEEKKKGAALAGMVVGGAGGQEGRQRLESQGVGASGEGLKTAVDYARTHYIDPPAE